MSELDQAIQLLFDCDETLFSALCMFFLASSVCIRLQTTIKTLPSPYLVFGLEQNH